MRKIKTATQSQRSIKPESVMIHMFAKAVCVAGLVMLLAAVARITMDLVIAEAFGAACLCIFWMVGVGNVIVMMLSRKVK